MPHLPKRLEMSFSGFSVERGESIARSANYSLDAEKMLGSDRPPIYWHDRFMQLINLLWIPMVVLLIILLVLNWKITLIVGLIAWLLGGGILTGLRDVHK